MRAIIIDDEQRARDVLLNLLTEFCPDVDIVATCHDIPSAVIAINNHHPDFVFLDIEMPNYSGFELFSFFKEVDFKVIFVTAYSEYAIRAFQVSAIDYLLKPIDIEKLEAAVEKMRAIHNSAELAKQLETLQTNLENPKVSRISLPVTNGLVFLNIDDIIHLEADGSYTNITLMNQKRLFICRKLKYFDMLLHEASQFYRIHRSHIVNIKHIVHYNRNDATLKLENDIAVRVARNKKQSFESYIRQYNE